MIGSFSESLKAFVMHVRRLCDMYLYITKNNKKFYVSSGVLGIPQLSCEDYLVLRRN